MYQKKLMTTETCLLNNYDDLFNMPILDSADVIQALSVDNSNKMTSPDYTMSYINSKFPNNYLSTVYSFVIENNGIYNDYKKFFSGLSAFSPSDNSNLIPPILQTCYFRDMQTNDNYCNSSETDLSIAYIMGFNENDGCCASKDIVLGNIGPNISLSDITYTQLYYIITFNIEGSTYKIYGILNNYNCSPSYYQTMGMGGLGDNNGSSTIYVLTFPFGPSNIITNQSSRAFNVFKTNILDSTKRNSINNFNIKFFGNNIAINILTNGPTISSDLTLDSLCYPDTQTENADQYSERYLQNNCTNLLYTSLDYVANIIMPELLNNTPVSVNDQIYLSLRQNVEENLSESIDYVRGTYLQSTGDNYDKILNEYYKICNSCGPRSQGICNYLLKDVCGSFTSLTNDTQKNFCGCFLSQNNSQEQNCNNICEGEKSIKSYTNTSVANNLLCFKNGFSELSSDNSNATDNDTIYYTTLHENLLLATTNFPTECSINSNSGNINQSNVLNENTNYKLTIGSTSVTFLVIERQPLIYSTTKTSISNNTSQYYQQIATCIANHASGNIFKTIGKTIKCTVEGGQITITTKDTAYNINVGWIYSIYSYTPLDNIVRLTGKVTITDVSLSFPVQVTCSQNVCGITNVVINSVNSSTKVNINDICSSCINNCKCVIEGVTDSTGKLQLNSNLDLLSISNKCSNDSIVYDSTNGKTEDLTNFIKLNQTRTQTFNKTEYIIFSSVIGGLILLLCLLLILYFVVKRIKK